MAMERVAFQGERGAFSEMATLQYFSRPNLVPLRTFHDLFSSMQNDTIDFGVVPIENSIEGSINEVYDLLLDADLVVSGEIYQRIRHCLIVNKDTNSLLKTVYSHPQALAQCRHFLQQNGLDAVSTYDTAGAVKMIKEKGIMDGAAIASRRAAELYDMKILQEGIEDKKNNFTRFFVLSHSKTKSTGRDRSSIILSVKHMPGSLCSILEEFAKRHINLTKLESRPTKETPWEYNFYVDFEGHLEDESIKTTMRSIQGKTSFLKILGSYKKADLR